MLLNSLPNPDPNIVSIISYHATVAIIHNTYLELLQPVNHLIANHVKPR